MAGLGVEQVRGRHIGEDLRPDQIGGCELERFLCVQFQSSELAIIQPQREAVDRAEAGLGCGRGEPGKGGVLGQVADRHVLPGPVGLQARPFLKFHLQGFDAEDHVVGGGDEMVLAVAVHQQHPSAADRNDLHDPVGEMVEDLLDGEITGQSPRELHENRRQPLLIHHPSDLRTSKPVRHLGPERLRGLRPHFTPNGDRSRLCGSEQPVRQLFAPALGLLVFGLYSTCEPRWRKV